MRLFRMVVVLMLILVIFTTLTNVFAIGLIKTNTPSTTNVQIKVTDLAARWQIGSSITIHWTINVKNRTGKIELIAAHDTSNVLVIATNVPLDEQQYTWKMPSNFPAGAYVFEIIEDSSRLCNVSNQFLIQDLTAKLTILEPKDGSIFNCKSLAQIPIKWSYSGDPGKTVQIVLVGSNNKYYGIGSALIGTGGNGVFYVQLISLSHFIDLLTSTLDGRIRLILENGDYVDGPNVTLNL